jgi:hypothetical protein
MSAEIAHQLGTDEGVWIIAQIFVAMIDGAGRIQIHATFALGRSLGALHGNNVVVVLTALFGVGWRGCGNKGDANEQH